MSRPTGGKSSGSRNGNSAEGRSGSSRRPASSRSSASASTSVSVPRPRGSRSVAQARMSPISSFGALAAVGAILLSGLGYGYATRTDATAAVKTTAVQHLPVTAASAICQALTGSGSDSYSKISAFAPGAGTAAGATDTASFGYFGGGSPLKAGGLGASAVSDPIINPPQVPGATGIQTEPVFASAAGAYAPGFTVGESIRTDTRLGRGSAAAQCAPPATDFWFAGVTLAQDKNSPKSELYLANPDDTAATLDFSVYGPSGPVAIGINGQNIQLAPHSSTFRLLSTLTAGTPADPAPAGGYTIRVTAQVGRVGAQMLDIDGPAANGQGQGIDFIPAQDPATAEDTVKYIPGVPAGQPARIDLTVTATGSQDASLDKVEWVNGTSSFPVAAGVASAKPAPNTTLLTVPDVVKIGTTATIDLSSVPRDPNEAGMFKLTFSGGPAVAGIRIVAKTTGTVPTDVGYLAPAQPITAESIVVDNHQGGAAVSWLYLTNPAPQVRDANGDLVPGNGATVKITRVGVSGPPAAEVVTVKAGTTVSYGLLAPAPGQTDFTTVLDVQAGSVPVYGGRELLDSPKTGTGILMSVQTLEPARLTAAVPQVEADLSGAVKG